MNRCTEKKVTAELASALNKWRAAAPAFLLPLLLATGLQAQTVSVINAASFSAVVAPGSIVTIFGPNLTTTTAAAADASQPPAILGKTSVVVGGSAATLFYVSPFQINAVLATSTPVGTLEGGEIDQGNAQFAGQEAMIIVDDVFVPNELIFMDGETEFAASLVERFTAYHRRSYVCKTGLGDVIIGAAALIADYNGVAQVSHVRDKLVEMTHLNETIYGAGIAASHESKMTSAGNYQPDDMLANVCKQNVTRFPYELARLAQDLAGGLMATLPSEKDFDNPETGPLLRKYLKGRDGVKVEDRARILRLIENMTMGRNAVGYLTESMHGAGSPQAQRIQIARQMKLEEKKDLAKALAGIRPGDTTK